ncbi:MAG: PBSX family phage terminase large subunit [Bacteroidales bacterium]|nr:PBSX family phage terminase large subunit [Bacteroidales bacterium]
MNQGGSRSGKTYSILQLLILVKAFEERNQVFSIVRKSMPALRATAMRDFFDILRTHDLYDQRNHNKTENTYILNDNLVEFMSLDQPQKKRGAKRTYLFLNEANELSLEDWIQLSMRTEKQIFLDYNPSMDEHWIYETVISREDCTFIHSTYLDNIQFLPEEVIKEIENLKAVDENYWRIYGMGEIGQITGLVLTNWEVVEAFPETCDWVSHGMDFGFTNDPTVIVKVGMNAGEIWVDELVYSRGLTTRDILQALSELAISKGDDIIADNQPQSIFEIRREGFNIRPTFKGPNSIITGIDILKRFRIKVTKRSINLIRELKNYKWKEDSMGNAMNQPVDKFNHAIDALRYVCMDRKLAERRVVRVRKL